MNLEDLKNSAELVKYFNGAFASFMEKSYTDLEQHEMEKKRTEV